MPSNRRIYITIPLGINVRDILRLGTLDSVCAITPSVTVVLLTPARLVEEFKTEFASPRVEIANLDRFRPSETLGRLVAYRRRFHKRGIKPLALALEGVHVRPSPELRTLFQEKPAALVISTHPQDWWDWEVVAYARSLGIPTLGLLRSWDNVIAGINVYTDYLAVWNQKNFDDAVALEGYAPERLKIIGAPPFDLYFDPKTIKPRVEYFKGMGLDANRPLIVYAPAGRRTDYGDEAATFGELLKMKQRVSEFSNAQFICRLHPHSRVEAYWPYQNDANVRLSFSTYMKALGWSMTREEVCNMANMLCHADVVVSGFTTVMIEAAIFNTPTIVAGFCTVQPEQVAGYLKGWTYNSYFRDLVERGLMPVAWSVSKLESSLLAALAGRQWGAEQRKALLDRYLSFRDGRSAERAAQWIAELLERPHQSAVPQGALLKLVAQSLGLTAKSPQA